MTKTEIETLKNVIARLSAKDKRCSREVQEALSNPNLRIYLDSWVIPALELLLPGEKRDPKLAHALSD